MLRPVLLLPVAWAAVLVHLGSAGAAAAAPAATGAWAAVQDGDADAGTESDASAGSRTPPDDGPRVIVRGFEAIGAERLDRDRLRETLGVVVGEPLEIALVRRGIDSLMARGLRPTIEYLEVEDGLRLRLTVVELPVDLTPRFVGHEREDLDQVLEWAGLRPGEGVRLSQASAIAQRIEERYRQDGYPFVEVDAVLGDAVAGDATRPPTQDVIFEIKEGTRVHIAAVKYEGNDSLPNEGWGPWRSGLIHEARPESRRPTLEWLFFGLFAKPYREDTLREDVVAMRQAYRDLGYLDAVVEVDRLEFSRDRRWVTIHVRVDEGEPYRVRSLRIEGYERRIDPQRREFGGVVEVPTELDVPEDELLALCKLVPGDVLTQFEIGLDRSAITDRYADLGRVAHASMPYLQRFEFLEPEFVFAEGSNEVDVTYRVSQGTEQFLREFVIRGNARTRDRVVRREFGEVFEGDRIDLSEVERGLARLRGTGYFSASEANPFDHREPTFRFEDTDDPRYKDLVVEVEEGGQVRFDFGIQWDADRGFAGRIGVTLRNFDISRWPSWRHPINDIASGRAFRGAGQTLQLSAQPGTDFSRYSIVFTEPDLFGRHLDRIGGRISLSRNFLGPRTHLERRDSAGFSLFRQLDPDTQISIGYQTTDIEVSDLALGPSSVLDPLGVPDLLVDQLGDSRVAGLDLGLRRRLFDSRFNPRDGYSAGASLFVSDPALGSDFEYATLQLDYDLVGTFHEEEGIFPIYRLRLLAGTSVPYGDTDDLPYTEREFLGGSRRMRGFSFRGVGPNQRGHPIGGETILYASGEYLWPLVTQPIPGTTRRVEVIRWGLFADAGLLDPDSFSADLDEHRFSVGFLLGMVQPIPLTLNFGFPITRGDGDRRRTFSFTLSY